MRLEELPPHDCFVTAANSYGIMTAGIDAAVVRFHGQDPVRRIQNRIQDEHLGEQPIGTCSIEPTGKHDYPFELGQVLMVKVAEELWIANMVGQEAWVPRLECRLSGYEAIAEGLCGSRSLAGW